MIPISINFFLSEKESDIILYTLIALFLSVITYILINKKLKSKEKLILTILCLTIPILGCLISIYYVKEFELIDSFKKREINN